VFTDAGVAGSNIATLTPTNIETWGLYGISYNNVSEVGICFAGDKSSTVADVTRARDASDTIPLHIGRDYNLARYGYISIGLEMLIDHALTLAEVESIRSQTRHLFGV